MKPAEAAARTECSAYEHAKREARAAAMGKRRALELAAFEDANSSKREGCGFLLYDTPQGLLLLELRRARWWETWLEPPIRLGWKEDAK